MGRKRIKNPADLSRIREKTGTFQQVPDGQVHVVIGMNTCGIASGARDTAATFRKSMARRGVSGKVFQTGCIGMCFHEPLVDIVLPDRPRITYRDVTADRVDRIVEEHLKEGSIVRDWALTQIPGDHPLEEGIPTFDQLPFNRKQHRIVLRRCGFIDPEDITHCIATGGYFSLAKALHEMHPDEVIETIRASGLRGRGGAGFPTGMKWQFARQAVGSPKYVVCNADEGDPGAFMDRSVLEGDPHAVLEGMMIAAYAIGAVQGYIYVRAEYPLAVQRLEKAIAQARQYGLLGEEILGTALSFDVTLKLGAGAFVCGEETALLASIEGQRGMPRPRPPFPVEKGLWGKPTSLNNVETFANIAPIIREGPQWYQAIGTENSKGTKVFCITGKVQRSGLIEVPMGITLREMVFDIAGGIPDGRAFKAVQTGGPSGGVLPESLLSLPVDYQELTEAGSIMGSGGVVVMDETTCMADMARYFLAFTKSESCGQCTPCREGLERLHQILERICRGQAEEKDLDELEKMALIIKDASLCGLGQSAPNPVLTVLRYFPEEIKAHVLEKRCPAGVCRDLVTYVIDTDKCSACGLCRKACPVEAIKGAPNIAHEIDQGRCIRCGSCYDICPPKFSAVIRK